MTEIRCPNCGRNNPDLLDVCQFCQTPLKPDSVLRIGEKPTKKNTGELQSILPDWLKDLQQQSKDAAEEEASQTAGTRPQKEEPPDLLAGLASQAGSADEGDVPDWLASLNPEAKAKPSAPSAATDASGSDFFAQFDQKPTKPESQSEIPPQEDTPSWMSGAREEATIPFEKDELSEWFTQASEQPEEVVESEEPQNDMGWGGAFKPSASAEKSTPKEEEDLSWLHNLEAAAKQTGDLQTPKKEPDWTANFETPSMPSPSSASQDDLSWLDRLGGIEDPSQPTPEQTAAPGDDLGWLDQFGGTPASPQSSQPGTPQEDLSWLNNLGTVSEPQPVDAAPNQPISPPPFASEEDVDWLNKLGGTPEPAQPFSVPEEKPSTEKDLSWLNNLGKPAESSTPAAQEGLSWMDELGGEPEPLSTPPFDQAEPEKTPSRQTAPLGKKTEDEAEPDWLKSATQAPSMPAPGDLSMDWFSGSSQPEQEKTPPSLPQAAPFEADIFSTPGESAALSNQDVDSLFSVEMPDWLSRSEPGTTESDSRQSTAEPAEGDESLAPVDLPSWVQAMRPVEAVITETTPSVSDQPVETEGPLAGLHGVIPIASLGSSRRPRPVSLTLQASDEQQASAILLEQILGSETSPRTLITSSVVASQQWLRWALTGLFLLVLSAVILMRSQLMPVSANLPEAVSGLSNAAMSIPVNSRILVVIDYEPSLAGEMEAIAGPLLDQIVLLSQPNLSFVSTSPNGAALVERLMANTGINQAGGSYLNLGYLPGGSAGVLGFIEAPGQILPSAGVGNFSEYSALVVLTDHAESGRVWVEQIQNQKTLDPALTNQPFLMVASAQAGPLLQPYVASRQITGMISGLADAARYEFVNNSRPGIVRSYWDTFGIGLMLSVTLIIVGSLWSLYTGMRARRANAEQG
ncbi:MAG TPA: hypothetical protein VJ821_17325 [Anaerolineales bacterium]|nr:hypothetical protein [Anaerolineales bacterium]